IAYRYLWGKRKHGFISLITYISTAGVFLGTFVLIVALAIANGFEKEVRDRIIGTLAHAKISQYHDRHFDNYDSIRVEILKHPEILGAAPYIMAKGGIEYDEVLEYTVIMGIETSIESTVTVIDEKIIYGSFTLDSIVSNRDRKLPGIIIGLGLADKIGAREGAEVVLMTLVTVEGEIDPVPKMMRFAVTGIFETGMYEYDLNLIYISLSSAQNLCNKMGVEGIWIRTSDIYQAGRVAKEAKDIYLGGYPFKSIDWLSQNKSLFQWMKLEKLIIFIVISLIIVVAAFNIISSLIMTILEKRREIGILMSMGSSSQSIMKIFMLNGSIAGFFGSTAGTSLGVILCLIQYKWQLIPLPGDIYFINRLPMLVNVLDVVLVYVSANLICLFAASYPAWHASKTIPAESIRYE
ncbi:MAG: ABC transporter permease, partial [Chitinispirillia bacterium]